MKQYKQQLDETPKMPDLGGLFTPGETLDPELKRALEGGTVKSTTTNQAKDVKSNIDSFVKADEKDAEQIVQKENTGKVMSSEWFYETERETIDVDGAKKVIVGYTPSYTGVIICMQKQGNLEVVGNPLPEHIPSKFIYTVQVKDTAKNISVYGQGFCTRMEYGVVNAYAQSIALSIALRNGYKKLLYPEIVKEVLDEWYKKKFGEEQDMSQIIVVSGDALKDLKSFI